jgi:transposase
LARGDLTDVEWRIVEPLLPKERGRKSRPSHDNRQFMNGMLHVLRVGCPWRDMHERYGKWNSVYVRFRRWAEQGVWDALLETLVELGLTDIGSTCWTAPQFAAIRRQRALKGDS